MALKLRVLLGLAQLPLVFSTGSRFAPAQDTVPRPALLLRQWQNTTTTQSTSTSESSVAGETIVTEVIDGSTITATFDSTSVPGYETLSSTITTSTTRDGIVVPFIIFPGGRGWIIANPVPGITVPPPTIPPTGGGGGDDSPTATDDPDTATETTKTTETTETSTTTTTTETSSTSADSSSTTSSSACSVGTISPGFPWAFGDDGPLPTGSPDPSSSTASASSSSATSETGSSFSSQTSSRSVTGSSSTSSIISSTSTTISSEPLSTSSEPPSTSSEPPSTSSESPSTSSEPPTPTPEPPTTTTTTQDTPTPTVSITPLEVQSVVCHDEDDFPGHGDVSSGSQDKYSKEFSGLKGPNGSDNLSEGSPSIELNKKDGHGITYAYSVSWVEGCVTKVDEQSFRFPLGSPSQITAYLMMRENYTKCNNGGVGGSTQVGCLKYTFTGAR